MDTDFKELAKDENFVHQMKQFDDVTERIKDHLKLISSPDLYDNLSNSDKIKYNLLMSFSMNSLFWMYLRAEGLDPTKHQIRVENDRLKQSMTRAKQINDRKHMPRVNKSAAHRFVRNGLWIPKDRKDQSNIDDVHDGDITEDNWESGT